MALLKYLLVVVSICAVGVSSNGFNATKLSNIEYGTRKTTRRTSMSSSTPSTTTRKSWTTNYYTDDSNICFGSTYGNINFFNHEKDDAYVRAWGQSPRRAIPGGCCMTFTSYDYYGLKVTLVGGSRYNHISLRHVTLKIYEGSNLFGKLLVWYTCL